MGAIVSPQAAAPGRGLKAVRRVGNEDRGFTYPQGGYSSASARLMLTASPSLFTEDEAMALPDFFVAGAPEGGTPPGHPALPPHPPPHLSAAKEAPVFPTPSPPPTPGRPRDA